MISSFVLPSFEVPEVLFDDEEAERRWRRRVRAPRESVPVSARLQPDRSIYRSSASGTAEIYAWDRRAGAPRQVTKRPNGTLDAAITPSGQEIWWFADTDGNAFGSWMREPFAAVDGATAQAALPELPSGYACGLALGQEVTVVGLADGRGTTVWSVPDGSAPQVIYQASTDAMVRSMSADEAFVVLTHAEHGDARNPGVCVLRTSTGERVGERGDDGQRLIPMGFSPVPGDQRLLLTHERRDRTELLIWDVETDRELELHVPLDGDLQARWGSDGSSLLVIASRDGRCRLHLFDIETAQVRELPTPSGTITDVSARPDGALEYSWSSSAQPWTLRTCLPDGTDRALFEPPPHAPTSVAVQDVWVDGAEGPVHVLISRPPQGAPASVATVFRLHGGPHEADSDSFNAMRAAWVDAGFIVVQVNYRGSSGYGATWRNTITGRPGVTELADVMAAQRWCIETGVARADRCVVEGYSWGGLLALLAVGVHPDSWAAAVGGLPLADCIAGFEDEMPSVQAEDTALFGGTPTEVPEVFRRASPITYAAQVRVPVLLLAGENDPNCPIRQVENYARALEEAGGECHLLRYDIGHGPQVAALVESFVLAGVSFARAALAPGG